MDGARFPEVAKEVDAQDFDFFGVIPWGGLNFRGPFIAEQAPSDGHNIALLFIANKDEAQIFLAEAAVLVFEPDFVLFGSDNGFDGGSDFFEVIERQLFRSGVEEFEDASGDNGVGAAGESLAIGAGDFSGFADEALEAQGGLFLLKPALVASAPPSIEVLAFDGVAAELGGEDFFDGRKAVEPGENVGGGLAVQKAMVELLADFVGKAGDFAGEITVRAGRQTGGLRRGLIGFAHRYLEVLVK
jgi:hypothetical protein